MNCSYYTCGINGALHLNEQYKLIGLRYGLRSETVYLIFLVRGQKSHLVNGKNLIQVLQKQEK